MKKILAVPVHKQKIIFSMIFILFQKEDALLCLREISLIE